MDSKFIKRLVLGLPPIIPTYIVNLGSVYILISIFKVPAIGTISFILVGDVIAYVANTYFAPYILRYLKWTKFFTKEELEQ